MSNAKEYLERIKRCDVKIDAKLEELETLKSMVKRITPILKDTGAGSGNGNQDRIGDTIAKIVDLQNEINADVDVFVNLKREASQLLDKLEKAEYYQVLHKRYVVYKSFEQIAAEMQYTYRNACYIHGRALQAFDKVLEGHKRRTTT